MSDWENFKKIFQLHVDLETPMNPRGHQANQETPMSPRGHQANQERPMSPREYQTMMNFPSPSLSTYDEISEYECTHDEPPHNNKPKLLLISLFVTTSLFLLRKIHK